MIVEANEETLSVASSLKTRLAERMFGAGVAASMAVAKETEVASYLAAIPSGSNIVGFGYGIKWTGSGVAAMNAVRVYVRKKLPRRDVAEHDLIPDEIDGAPTDVIPIGEIRAAFPRPVRGGFPGGHRDGDGGTLGCVVDSNGAGRYILSNNHVLANVNRAAIGDPPLILEPDRVRGGSANPPIARLSAFTTIALGGPLNEIDAAIAELVDPSAMSPEIAVIGRVNQTPITPVVGMSVRKTGAATDHRIGVVDGISEDVEVTYTGVGFAKFEKQIAVVGAGMPFGDGGDSGSLVVDTLSLRPVGLLFAVKGLRVFCNYASKVLGAFNARVL